jgi:hypothetical protein
LDNTTFRVELTCIAVSGAEFSSQNSVVRIQ